MSAQKYSRIMMKEGGVYMSAFGYTASFVQGRGVNIWQENTGSKSEQYKYDATASLDEMVDSSNQSISTQ